MNTSTSLMELGKEYLELVEMAADPKVDEQALIDTMEAITGEIEVKAGGYVAVMNHLQSRVDLYKGEAKRLAGAAKVMENSIERMKDRIKGTMKDMGVKVIEAPYNTIKIVGNGGVQPLKIDGDVPDKYKRIVYETDNEKIRKDLEKGVKLDFAHLEPRGTRLSIT